MFGQDLRLRPVRMRPPTRYIGILESTKIKIDSPVRSRAASGRYQPQAGDQGSPPRAEWPSTWLRDLSPTFGSPLRAAFAGPTPQQTNVRAAPRSGCPTSPHRPVRLGVAYSWYEYNVLPGRAWIRFLPI